MNDQNPLNQNSSTPVASDPTATPQPLQPTIPQNDLSSVFSNNNLANPSTPPYTGSQPAPGMSTLPPQDITPTTNFIPSIGSTMLDPTMPTPTSSQTPYTQTPLDTPATLNTVSEPSTSTNLPATDQMTAQPPAVSPSESFAWSQPAAPIPPTTAIPDNVPNPNISLQDLYGVTPVPTDVPSSIETSQSASTDTPTIPQAETVPEDLSQLIANQAESPSVYAPPLSQPQTLITPSNQATPVATTAQTTSKASIPKWIIGLGVGLLLMVAAASAYFILGIGQNTPDPSAPATNQQSQTITPPKTPAPTPIQTPSAAVASSTPVATGSASFGNIVPTSQTSSGSALELLKQQQIKNGQ